MNRSMKDEDKEIVTKDLHIISYFLTVGFKFSQSPRLDENHNIVNFYFLKTKDIEQARQDYYGHRARVDPAVILKKFHDVKSLAWAIRKGMYEGKDENQDVEGNRNETKTME